MEEFRRQQVSNCGGKYYNLDNFEQSARCGGADFYVDSIYEGEASFRAILMGANGIQDDNCQNTANIALLTPAHPTCTEDTQFFREISAGPGDSICVKHGTNLQTIDITNVDMNYNEVSFNLIT